MAPKATHDPQYLDADHEAIVTFANTYFDDDDERSSFVDHLLERRGYQRTSGWSLPAPPSPDGGGGGAPPQNEPPKHPYFKR